MPRNHSTYLGALEDSRLSGVAEVGDWLLNKFHMRG